jgi:hypothetical protein
MNLLRYIVVICLCSCLCLVGCGADSDGSVLSVAETTQYTEDNASEPTETNQEMVTDVTEEDETVQILIKIGDETLTAIPENNSSAEAFVELLRENPITVQMSDYASMEKVGSLGTSLPRNDTPISVGAGDVILYQGNQITIYYGTNSWNFTRLARIEGATEDSLRGLLGDGDVEVTFSVKE